MAILTLSVSSMAQVIGGNEAKAAFEYLYDFNFKAADSVTQSQLNKDGESAYWNLVSAYVAWSQILAGKLEDEYWNERFHTDIRKAKDILKETDLNSNDDLFAYIIVHAFKTRHELLNDNYLNAASDLNTCIDQISESFGREEQYYPFHLTAGLYYYFMWLAHEDYFWIRPYLLLYPEGDKEKGLAYLNKTTNSEDLFLRNESLYFLMRIYFDLEEDFNTALKYANRLVKENPNNLIYCLFQYRSAKEIDMDLAKDYRNKYVQKVRSNVSLTSQERAHFMAELDKDD